MLPVYLDHHIPSAIADGLRRRGLDVVTAFEDGFATAPDEVLLDRAGVLGRLIVTCDEDFLVIAREFQQSARHFTGIIYGHQFDLTIGETIRDIELIVRVLRPEEIANSVVFLPL